MSRIPNTMIRASAGSGKTFQLTNRFIRLLLSGQAPERIIALTFTRKAAGEFFEGILTKLAKAAVDSAEAKGLAEDLKGARWTIDELEQSHALDRSTGLQPTACRF